MSKAFFIGLIVALAVTASAQVAFADTVDAAAQHYMVGGGVLAGLVFLVLGLIFFMRGRGTRQMARASVHWPVTDGKILAANIVTEIRQTGRSGRYEVYIPKTRYSYSVAGNRIEGNIIRPGIDQFGYGIEAQAKAHLDPYKVGATVPVRYDPANPAIAVLELGEYGGARNIFGGTVFMLVGIAAFIFAVWASTLTPI